MMKPILLGLLGGLLAGGPAWATSETRVPQQSQDGSVLVMASDTQIFVFDGSGNQTKTLPLASPITTMYLSPDGANLAFTDATGLWVENLGTAVKAQVVSPVANQLLRNLKWAPNSGSFTFTIATMQATTNPAGFTQKQLSLYMVNADGSGSKLLMSYSPAP